jgi:4-amino-4-deoxy-L-arabinose transferase-like glycosyltransferase
MNLDELKMNWKTLDDRFSATQKLTEQMFFAIIKEQSKGTVTKIQNKLKRTSFFFSGLFLLFVLIISGNPFDYTHWYEFIPAVLYTFLVLAVLKIIFQEIIVIRKITLARSNLRESLQAIITLQERFNIVMDTIWKISISIGFLFGISLMIHNFKKYGLFKSTFLVAGFAFVVLVMFFLAKSFFKNLPDTNNEELKMNLAELDSI